MSEPLRLLSLGAGRQSTTIFLMSHVGELPPLDGAIFADTRWEGEKVYRHLLFLASLQSIPIYVVNNGDIRADALEASRRIASMPHYVDTGKKKEGRAKRQCSGEYKVKPIMREVRRLMAEAGIKRKPGAVEQWIGFSAEPKEVLRIKPAPVAYVTNRWPLIEKRMTVPDCLRWIREHGFPDPPRSSCIGCPFHSDEEWRSQSPEEFADAVEFDAAIRHGNRRDGVDPMRGKVFLHRSLKPLPLVDLSTLEDHGQENLFVNQCEGECAT